MTVPDAARNSGSGAPGAWNAARVAAWAGLVAHGILGLFPYAFTGLLAPAWAVATVGVVWLGLLVVGIRSRRKHPWMVAAIPVAGLTFWFVFLTFGDLVLGWTA